VSDQEHQQLSEVVFLSTPYSQLFTPPTRVKDKVNMGDDLSEAKLMEAIQSAEYWAIELMIQAEIWGSVETRIRSGEVLYGLFNATVYYAACECLQKIFASGGERSEFNFPESFSSRSVGGLSAGQPDWKFRCQMFMKQAEESLTSFIQFERDEIESVEDNLLASVSNRDPESHMDEVMGLSTADMDFW